MTWIRASLTLAIGVCCLVGYIVRTLRAREMNQPHQANSFGEEQQNIHSQPVENGECSYTRDLDEGATTQSAQNSRRSSVSNECCYCKNPIRSLQETSKLDCQHLAHKDCYNSLKDLFQCQACNAGEY